MNTKLLKQKILDLAIRGKLTDQRKSDGTAADLLKQISEQKRESSSTLSSPRRRGSPSAQSEKTIIPLDKNEAPFEVPANWEWVRLGDVVLNRDAERKPVSKKDRNLHAQKIYDYYGAAGAIDKVEEYLFDEKLLLIGEDGANLLSRSKPNAFLANGKYWVNNHAHVIDAIDKSMLDYLAFYINAISLDDFVTGTAQPKLNQENLNKIPIPLPPLAEQQRVVAKIEEAFAEIDAIEKNKELLKTHIKQTRQKILDLAIHGKLVPQNNSDEPASVLLERITRDNPHYEKMEDEPFEIPENWAWVRINDIASDMADGPFGSNLKAEHYTDKKEARIIQLSNIAENGWKDENVRYTTFEHAKKNISRSIVEAGNLVIAKMMPAGRAMICPSTEKMYVLSSDAVKLVPVDEINNQFLCYAINSPYFKAQVNGNIQGTTRLRTSISKLRECLLALPPLAEQARIVAKIEELFSTLDQMERNLI